MSAVLLTNPTSHQVNGFNLNGEPHHPLQEAHNQQSNDSVTVAKIFVVKVSKILDKAENETEGRKKVKAALDDTKGMVTNDLIQHAKTFLARGTAATAVVQHTFHRSNL